jgi:hypothetical protein
MQGRRVAELSVADYAVQLGLSSDTVRRRIRAGTIPARSDAQGHYIVLIPDDDAPTPLHAVHGVQVQETDVYAEPHAAETLRLALLHARELAEAERRRADEQGVQLAMLREQLAAHTKGEEELRALLLRQSEQLARVLPAPRTVEPDDPQVAVDPQPVQPQPAPARPQPQPQRRRRTSA